MRELNVRDEKGKLLGFASVSRETLHMHYFDVLLSDSGVELRYLLNRYRSTDGRQETCITAQHLNDCDSIPGFKPYKLKIVT